ELNLNAGRYVKIDVVDYGTGIPKEKLSHIFDPYFSTKGLGGLGLTAALSIVKRHHGNITVESAADVGSKFSVYLPGTDKQPETALVGEEPEIRGAERILLMDDEEGILEVGSELLREHGFKVGCAHNGEEAVTLYSQAKTSNEPYDLVVMDLTIKGGMGGKEAIRELLSFDPNAKAIVSSGYSNDPVMAHFAEHGFKGVVKKPYMISEMIKEIRQVLDSEDGPEGI
ncbi:MAG TPA: response regulator, partial [Methanomassiliicoccales archaeon]|nr:response regulator [Methanomassiliicoccales archaeon]